MTTVLFLLLTVAGCCLGRLAQATQPRMAPATLKQIDLLRFRLYDVNKDGNLDLQDQVAKRQSRTADLAKRRERLRQYRTAWAEKKRQADLERFDPHKTTWRGLSNSRS